MQEEVENRSVNLAITTTRMTARAKTHKDTVFIRLKNIIR